MPHNVHRRPEYRPDYSDVRSLAPAPQAFLDATGAPAFGSYAGPLPRVELAAGVGARFARRKRWVWFGIASPRVFVSSAVVRTGYAVTAFLFAYDREEKRMLAEATVLGPAAFAKVADDPRADGVLAKMRFGRSNVKMTRTKDEIAIALRLPDVELDATLDFAPSPPALTAIANLGDGLVDATEKRALARVKGTARFAGKSVGLDGALGGYDYTHGLLPRHTKWRWGFALGHDVDEEPVAFNFCEGFVGEAECAAFVGGEVHPLAEPRFHLDADMPELPWRLSGEGIDLEFVPGAVHVQNTKLLVVRSRFVQPVGAFYGTVRAGGRDIRVDGLPGVVEDQDVLW